jgi:ABC-type transporter Mla maintaining outer membrane lipid asymmetry ATPase subunit MlaF
LYNIIESERNEVSIDKYLKNIEMTVDKFMEKNSVWDRKELVGGLEDITRKKGTFARVLGGKSTGKSLVLREFSKQEENNKKVIYVNMRSGYESITHGFLSVINKSNNAELKNII